MSVLTKSALRWSKSVGSYNPIPGGCVLYLPLWSSHTNGLTFPSIDSFGHTCTRSGSTSPHIRANGHYFNGSDDYISQATLLDSPPANVSIGFWFSPAVDWDSGEAVDDYLLDKTNIAFKDRILLYLSQANGKLTLGVEYDDGGLENVNSDAASWTGGQFYSAWVTYDGTTWRMYIDSVLQADTQAMLGFMKAGTAEDFLIGVNSSLAAFFKGTIGECWAYNRALSVGEIDHIYSRTRGGYQ